MVAAGRVALGDDERFTGVGADFDGQVREAFFVE